MRANMLVACPDTLRRAVSCPRPFVASPPHHDQNLTDAEEVSISKTLTSRGVCWGAESLLSSGTEHRNVFLESKRQSFLFGQMIQLFSSSDKDDCFPIMPDTKLPVLRFRTRGRNFWFGPASSAKLAVGSRGLCHPTESCWPILKFLTNLGAPKRSAAKI